jgi:uncharacterized protein
LVRIFVVRFFGKFVLKIKISSLEFGINELEYSGNVAELGLEAPFYGKYELKVIIDKSHNQLLVSVNLCANATFMCDRCTADFTSAREIPFTLLFLFDEKSSETDDPDVFFLSREADKIDITTEIYDYAYLDIPFKNLCKEDCKGLCTSCGTDLNTSDCSCDKEGYNPLWKDLEKLKDEFNEEE